MLAAGGCGGGHGTDEAAVLRGAARSGFSVLHYDRAAQVVAVHVRGRRAFLVVRASRGDRAPEQHLTLVLGRRHAWRVVYATQAIVNGAHAARRVAGAAFARLRPQCPVKAALVSRRDPRYAVAYYACARRFPAILAFRIGRRWTAYDEVAQYDVPFACTDAARGVVVSLTGFCLVGTGS